MSFKSNDNHAVKITLANYEAYFILYIDKELSPEECNAVEKFLSLYPHLQEELALLQSTQFVAEEISLQNKESLFAAHQKIRELEDALLQYVDNELTGTEQQLLEEKISSDKQMQRQLQLLLKTRLDAEDKISYPYKNDLYRHPATKSSVFGWKIAASVLLAVGTVAWLWRTSLLQPVAMHTENPVQRQIIKPVDKASVATVAAKEDRLIQTKKNDTDKINTAVNPVMKKQNKKIRNKQLLPPAQLMEEVTMAVQKKIKRQNEPVPEIAVTGQNNKSSVKNIVQPTVSFTAPRSFKEIESLPNTSAENAGLVNVETNKKSTIKNLLRKATHIVERTTGINPVNDNNELLIGVAAVKL